MSRWRLQVAPSARRDPNRLPEKAAAAIYEFLSGALLERPPVVSKRLHSELAGRWSIRRGPYRVIYRLDLERHVIEVVAVAHRADSYRRR